jgi:hypothetical protein
MAATSETLASRDPGDETTAIRKTATAGPAAAQETTGKSGDANNSRDTRFGGKTMFSKRYRILTKVRKPATTGTPGNIRYANISRNSRDAINVGNTRSRGKPTAVGAVA